jgi:hypothetical protein
MYDADVVYLMPKFVSILSLCIPTANPLIIKTINDDQLHFEQPAGHRLSQSSSNIVILSLRCIIIVWVYVHAY